MHYMMGNDPQAQGGGGMVVVGRRRSMCNVLIDGISHGCEGIACVVSSALQPTRIFK